MDDDCRCLCERGWMGHSCDIPNCNDMYGCFVPIQCSGHGVCKVEQTGKPVCQCFSGWVGSCCSISTPIMSDGDPHFQTIDGIFCCDYNCVAQPIAFILFCFSNRIVL